MTEGRQPAITDEQVEARRKNHGDENLAREIDVVVAGNEWQRDGRKQQYPPARVFSHAGLTPAPLTACHRTDQRSVGARAFRLVASPQTGPLLRGSCRLPAEQTARPERDYDD